MLSGNVTWCSSQDLCSITTSSHSQKYLRMNVVVSIIYRATFELPFTASRFQITSSRQTSQPVTLQAATKIMQLLSLLLFTLSAGALPQSHPGMSLEAAALPTVITSVNSTIPNSLEKRADYPWIGSFDNEKCSGSHMGHRPEVPLDHCVTFIPSQQWFSVYWGSFPLEVEYMSFYGAKDCDQFSLIKTLKGSVSGHSCRPRSEIDGAICVWASARAP